MFVLLKSRKGPVAFNLQDVLNFVVFEFHLLELFNDLDVIREVRNVF